MERPSPPSRPDSGVSDVEKAAHSPRADLPQFLAEDNGPALQSSQSASVGVLLFLVCILMHATLAGLHLALVILRYSVHGRSIEVPDHNFNQVTGLLFSRITLLPNAIIKVYLVPLLYITQKLALRRDLHQVQSLTAMHDKSKAWLSLGASGATIMQYRSLFQRRGDRTARRKELISLANVVGVLLYLIGVLLLGIFAPDLITLGDVVGNTTDFQHLTSYIPNIGQDPNQIQEAFPIVDIIPLLFSGEDVTTTGLDVDFNIVYDIPNFATDSDVFVNGTSFQVVCQNIEGAVQSGPFNTQNSTFPVHIHDELADVAITPASRTLNIRSAIWRDATLGTVPPPVLILASTFPILDDNNSSSSTVNLNPSVSSVNCAVSSDCSTVSSVQFMACNVEINKLGKNVQVFTNEFPLEIDLTNSSQIPLEPDQWSNWILPDAPTDPSLFTIGVIGDLSPPSHAIRYLTVPGSNAIGNDTLSMLEDNIMEALGYYREDVSSVSLEVLEEALEQSIAAIFWRGAVRAVNNATLPGDNFDDGHKYSIKISKWTPWLGFAISAMMTIIAVMLTRHSWPKNNQNAGPHVDGLGVLELTWLLGNDTKGVARDLATRVRDPISVNLREEGKRIPVSFCE